MKRMIALLLTTLLFISLASVSVSAVGDADWKDLKFSMIMQSLNGISYTGDEEEFAEGKYCMRGFAVSPDGKYMFGGFLNPNASSALEMFDTSTGKTVGTYVYTEDTGVRSYPKGLDCDDRGNLYVGLAWSPNYGTANLAILDYNQKDNAGYLKTKSLTKILEVSTPGDKNGTKTGVNGVKVKEVIGTYYAYIVINYDVDFLYRFNVTDPEHPELDQTFGDGGRVDLQQVEVGGAKLTEGNYLDVDDDGTIYLGYTSGNGAGVVKLSDDGKTVLGFADQTKGYGVALYGDYVLVSSQSSGNICVYTKSTLYKVAEFSIGADTIVLPVDEKLDKVMNTGVSSICNIRVANDVIFFADQGSESVFDQIFVTAVTPEGKASVDAMSKVLTDMLSASAVTEAPAVVTDAPVTAAPAVTEAPVATEAAIVTEAAVTDAPAVTEAPTPVTDAPSAKSGCGSVVTVLPAAALIAACFYRKKKD